MTNGFTVSYPDGSQNVYGFIVTNISGAFQNAYLTAHLNAQSQKTTFNYAAYTPGPSPVVRLQSVVDGDGRTNLIYYNSSNAYSTNLISQVVDAFGRTSFLSYNTNGDLTNITDVAGNSSSLSYDTNDWAANLTTPYGITTFSITDGTNIAIPNGRSIVITRPDNSHELYLYSDCAAGIPSAYATTPLANTFNNANMNYYNSFHWGPRQYAALSTTNIASFTANDFQKARMKHWLIYDDGRAPLLGYGDPTVNYLVPAPSLERDPSPDSAGNIEGQKTWYSYLHEYGQYFETWYYYGPGQQFYLYGDNQIRPLFTARILPDNSTSYVCTGRNSWGNITNSTSTYSAGGGVALRTTLFAYATNDIDIITITNALGVLVSSNSYNANHEVLTHFDALRELSSYTYNTNQQVASITLPNGLVTTNIYGVSNLLSQQIVVGFATNNFTYTNDLIYTHTDARGLTTTNSWENLNRLTGTTFPDGSSISNIYTKLDLTATKDRLGHWTLFGYDALRRNTIITNALNNVTINTYCSCGALESILDAGNNLTSFHYDNQGNLTNTVYADGYSTYKIYNLLGQMVIAGDSGGSSVTNTYNNQGLVTTVKNAAGTAASYTYDILDRVTGSVDANGVSINTTYDNLDRPLTRSYPDNGVEKWGYTPNVSGYTSHTNQIGNVTLCGYDSLGRKTNDVSVGVTTNGFSYDGPGDLLTLTDGRNQVTTWHYDAFGRVTNKVDAAGVMDFVYQYDANNRLTNRWTPAKGNTAYAYDAVGNRTNISYGGVSSISYAYDALNRMTNMVDGVGTNCFTYDAAGELLSVGGIWAGDTVNYAYTNRMRGGLTLGSWSQTYGYDGAKRLTNITSTAGSFGYAFDSTRKMEVSKLSLPNSAYIANSFDTVGRLTGTYLTRGTDNHVLDGYTYAYNPLGERTNVARDYGLMSSTASAGYDGIGQLTSWTGRESDGTPRLNEQLGYAYDPAGNLKQRTNNALVQAFGVDAANALTNITRAGALTASGNTPAPASSVTVNGQPALRYADFTFASSNGFALNNGQNSFTNIAKNYYGTTAVTNALTVNLPQSAALRYDANGNLTNDGTRAFYYDTENQLTNVAVAGQWSEAYFYDGLNRRRITRQYTWVSGSWVIIGSETRYIYDGNAVIQERDGNNAVQVTYTRGLGGLLARTDANGSTFYHADGNRNITALMDGSQYMVARYLYDPFGRQIGKWGTMADANTYRFASKEYDLRAGLYYFGRRYYDPLLQRFVNRDPIGVQGGLNLYAYCGNNPISFYDPLGLCWWTDLLNSLENGVNDVENFYYNGGVTGHALNGIGDWLNNYGGDNYLFGASAAFAGQLFDEAGAMISPSTYVNGLYSFGNNINTVYQSDGWLAAGSYAATSWNVGAIWSGAANINLATGQPVGDWFQRGTDISGGVVATVAVVAPVAAPITRALDTSFFDGATYTPKVLNQMANTADLHHSFPQMIDTMESAGSVRTVVGGDGIPREVLEIPGSINGKSGVYQYMKNPDGTINHRQFVPNN